jgi:RNA polymerase sigma-70 factor (ECF subfamily)
VFNLALQYVQNTEDAEDITQEVFVSIYKKLSSFREEAELSTWIYRIAINRSLDFIKSKKRIKRFSVFTSLFFENTNTLKHDLGSFDHPGVELEQKEALANIFLLINQLPDNQKTVLILLKIEGRSQKEVAEILNKSEKAVESLIQRARSNLEKMLRTAKE